MSLHASVSESNVIPPLFRLVHQDGSLADLTMLSASSVEATLPREEAEVQDKQEEQEGQEEQGEQGKWQSEEKEKEALVVVMYDTDKTGEKPGSLSDPRQSSTEESHHCSVKTEPEPSTEQSSGTEQVHSLVISQLQKSMLLFCCSMRHSVMLKYWFWRKTRAQKLRRFWAKVCETLSCMCNEAWEIQSHVFQVFATAHRDLNLT